MNTKKMLGLAVAIIALNFGILADAYAGIDVKCEARSGRSKASVDGFGLANGLYRARVTSGTASVWSKNLLRPTAGEVQFDFDSNQADVNAGATKISSTFIKNASLTGRIYLRNANGTYSQKGSETVDCRVK
jgi:hypothetical protein